MDPILDARFHGYYEAPMACWNPLLPENTENLSPVP